MAKQNIYDNETFFEGYMTIRDNEENANNLFEIPVFNSLLPDLTNKKVLDIGCGFGEKCVYYVQQGACSVKGIDISTKMLEVANRKNNHPNISYQNLPVEELSELHEKFDVITSSLVLHYVEDFKGVVKSVYNCLEEQGTFIFSQENPLCTCHTGGDRWNRDEFGNKQSSKLSNYGVEGERETVWFVEGIKKYHRTFSTLVNTLIEEGFVIEKMIEPSVTNEIIEKYPEYADLVHKPDFLLIKAKKQ